MMRVLLAGATGYIGRAVLRELVAEGHEVLLRPGDLLFIPAGWMHLVVNAGETVSLAVTIESERLTKQQDADRTVRACQRWASAGACSENEPTKIWRVPLLTAHPACVSSPFHSSTSPCPGATITSLPA